MFRHRPRTLALLLSKEAALDIIPGSLTVGLMSHHAEALPFLREQMERHDTIILEEPACPVFKRCSGAILPLKIISSSSIPSFPGSTGSCAAC